MALAQRLKRWGARGVNFGVLAAFATFAAFPFAWMLITTFKQTNDLLDPNHNPFVYHQPPTLEHLRILFFDTLFGRWVANTLFVGTSVVIITLALAIPAGYSLARLSGKFGEKLGIAIFLTYLVRGDVYFWGSLMGACFIASVPVAILYNLFVDRFISGFTVGSVKG